MDGTHRHQSHPVVINRLKRAHGHLRKVIEMIEATLIEDHLDHCLDTVVGPMDAEQRQEIADFKAIAKYL